MATRRSVVGLTWKKLRNSPVVADENKQSRSPITRSMSRGNREPLRENINREKEVNTSAKQESQDGKKTKALLRRVSSVRDAFGTLRQKMKLSSTRRRTRLLSQSPYCESPAIRTPASSHRKRFSNLPPHIQEEVKMYSPFGIDTPSGNVGRSPRTPRSIRMGIHTPKSIDFSSPNTRFKKDLEAVSQGLEELRGMGRNFGSVIKRQNSRRGNKDQ